MKRYRVIISIFVILILVTSIFLNVTKKDIKLDNVEIKKEVKNNMFAMYKQTSNNTYEEITDTNVFPTEGYILNLSKSKCIDENGNEIDDILSYDIANKKVLVDTNKTSYCYLYFAKEVVEFDYTGSEQEFTVPLTGTYKLEVWGAQGGTFGGDGGKGGYATGNIGLSSNDIIFVVVGGTTSDIYGGYNGGGTGAYNASAGGGGATHIASISGTLSTIENDKDKVFIVAGGGGGGNRYASGGGAALIPGGAGGGLVGGNPYRKVYGGNPTISSNTGGNQIGTYTNNDSKVNCAGSYPNIVLHPGNFGQGSYSGGAGWYGGQFYTVCNVYYSGAGGSSYIDGVSNGSTTAGQRTGNGYAKITFIG